MLLPVLLLLLLDRTATHPAEEMGNMYDDVKDDLGAATAGFKQYFLVVDEMVPQAYRAHLPLHRRRSAVHPTRDPRLVT